MDEIRVYKIVDGVEKLIRVEKSPTQLSRKERYGVFLKSKAWKRIRAKKWIKSKKRCAICQFTKNLHAHHLFYRDNWAETKNGDLRLLCADCHKMVHEAIRLKMLDRSPRHRHHWAIEKYFTKMCAVVHNLRKIKMADEQMTRLDEEFVSIVGKDQGGRDMAVDYKTEFYERIKPDYKGFEDNLPSYWVMKYRDRFLQMIEQLPVEKRSNPKILDVGCGTGRALSHFKEYGAVVLGVEPGDWAVSNSRLQPGEMIHSEFLEADITDKFDIVYFEQVLSHIPDYTKVLLKAKDMLSEGGILALEEPNEYNPLQMVIAKEKGIYWNTEDHCNYFTIMNMEFLLKEMGFKTVYKSCTFPMELFHLMGFDYIGDDECGKRVHFLRYKLLSGMEYKQRKELKEKFAEMGWGRDLFLIVRGLNNA